MYIVSIKNGDTTTEIHNAAKKLYSGQVVQGINSIDSFTFSVLPNSPAFGNLHDYQTFVTVYNTLKKRYEFFGRVLYTTPAMSDKGLITQEAICESFLGFLCDSSQPYVVEKNWTNTKALLEHIRQAHNKQVAPSQQFHASSTLTMTGQIYEGIQRKNSFEAIKEKLLDKFGGEIRFTVKSNNERVLEYAQNGFGEEKATSIELSKNMKAITKQKDPTAFITRLFPYGAKIDDDSEERVDISSVNGGLTYVDDEQGIAEYGIHCGFVEFDDITLPENLLTRAREWLAENNKVLVKYSVTALDLSLIGLDIDDFEVYNTHPIKNKFLGIDDKARIIKKTIDICDPTKTSIELGDNFKTLTELQQEEKAATKVTTREVAQVISNYVTKKQLQKTDEQIRLDAAVENAVIRGEFAAEDTAIRGEYAAGDAAIRQEVSATYATKDSLASYATKSSLEQTAQSITASVSATYETKENAAASYATKDSLSNYASNSKVEQTAEAITASVSATYATKDSLSNYATKDSLSEYATNSKVEQTAENITSTVAATYASKDSLSGYATKDSLSSYATNSTLEQTANGIRASIEETNGEVTDVKGELALKLNKDDLTTAINAKANEITITSDNFTLTADGKIVATGATVTGRVIASSGSIGGWKIDDGNLVGNHGSTSGCVVTLTPEKLKTMTGQDSSTEISFTWAQVMSLLSLVNTNATGLRSAASAFVDVSGLATFEGTFTRPGINTNVVLKFVNGILVSVEDA